MIAIATVLVVALVSLLITRVATMALTLTGMSREVARFQARSALSGAGYTTTEAEAVVNHPVRRRIVMNLMLLGSVGLVTSIATLMLSFVNADRSEAAARLGVLILALLVLHLAARSRWVDRRLSRLIAWILDRHTDLGARDYDRLLHLGGDFVVMELAVGAGHWACGRTLDDLRLRDEGVAVLGINPPDGEYVGAPAFQTRVEPGATLIVYGRHHRLAELSCRGNDAGGTRAREEALAEQRRRAGRGGHDLVAEEG